MVLEILSDTSERKDAVLLRQLYWTANVPEYWLVDVRGDSTKFQILRHTPDGYVETPAAGGWLPSAVLQHQFQLIRQTDALGHPQFVVAVQSI
jgi:Uma2 family endonuclease